LKKARRRQPDTGAISDEALRDLVMTHVRNTCHCVSSSYGDVPKQMAQHFAMKSHAAALEVRIARLLPTMKEQRLLTFTRSSGGGGICEVTLPRSFDEPDDQPAKAAAPAQPAPAPNPSEPPAPDPASEGGVMDTGHLQPRVAVMRKLILLYLAMHGSDVSEETGRVPTMFREFFGFAAERAVKGYFSMTTQVMRDAGEILTFRTPSRDPQEEEKHAKGKLNYGMTLVGDVSEAELEAIRRELPNLLKEFGGDLALAQENLDKCTAAKVLSDPPPADDVPADAGIAEITAAVADALADTATGGSSDEDADEDEDTDDEDEDSTDGVDLGWDDAGLRREAEEVFRQVLRGYTALREAAEDPETQKRGKNMFLIDGAGILSETFSEELVPKIRHYLRETGTKFVNRGQHGLAWWQMTSEAPTLEAMIKIIVDRKALFTGQPRHMPGDPPVEDRRAGNTPPVLPDLLVSRVVTSPTPGSPPASRMRGAVGVAPAPPAAVVTATPVVKPPETTPPPAAGPSAVPRPPATPMPPIAHPASARHPDLVASPASAKTVATAPPASELTPEQILAELAEIVEAQGARIESLEAKIRAQAEEITRLNQAATDRRGRIASLEEQAEDLRRQLSQRDEEIKRLKAPDDSSPAYARARELLERYKR
jgi:uncharacterized coiled-coil protein SlyX